MLLRGVLLMLLAMLGVLGLVMLGVLAMVMLGVLAVLAVLACSVLSLARLRLRGVRRRPVAVLVGVGPALEVAGDGLERVESHVGGAAGRRLLAAGSLAQQRELVHTLDPELHHALVHELVLAPGVLHELDALRQACHVHRHRAAREDLDGAVEAVLAVVEVHGLVGEVAGEVVAGAVAAVLLARGARGDPQRLAAAVALGLEAAHVGEAGRPRLVLRLADAALQLVGHLAVRLDRVHGGRQGEHAAQPAREEDRVRVHLYDPVVPAVAALPEDLLPEPVEDTRVERRPPPPAEGHGEGLIHEGDWHRGGHGRAVRAIADEDMGLIAEDLRLVAREDADAAHALRGQEAGLVAEGHHQREAIERGPARVRGHERRHLVLRLDSVVELLLLPVPGQDHLLALLLGLLLVLRLQLHELLLLPNLLLLLILPLLLRGHLVLALPRKVHEVR
mmetsp:Transcript_43890/g.129973  ORF Transcript_43890/g.129973 Transcript_43890/m.129973 type:complete len:448 (+) Transcript_43890:560-1903(+)